MIEEDEIRKAIRYLHDSHSCHDMDEVHLREKGIGAVLVYLLNADAEVKSVDICNAHRVSSARVAVILKKLEHKDLIIKSASKTDSRAITIKLTDKGRILAQGIEQDMYNTVSKIIETLGVDEFYKTFEKMALIRKILHENKPKNMEVLND